MSGPIKARRRPEVVDMWLYDGANAAEIAAWVGADAYTEDNGDLVISTPEGDHKVEPGDRVVKGLAGEHYFIKPEAYAAGYDEVEG